MPSPRISYNLNDRTYFLTFTVNKWINIFTSEKYFILLIENLKFYNELCNVQLYAYVLMTNHIHIICECKDMIKFVRSFKSYTSKQIIKLLKRDSRQYTLAILRSKSGYRIWRPGNWPILIETDDFFQQKLNYIHENPVIKGYVSREEDWLYSSARNYYNEDHSVIEIDIE